jgi:hypothetical protein
VIASATLLSAAPASVVAAHAPPSNEAPREPPEPPPRTRTLQLHGPPQSTLVSPAFWIPSLQVTAAWQTWFSQTPLGHCAPVLHATQAPAPSHTTPAWSHGEPAGAGG